VIVEDADSYNCFWQMPFRKSARIEVVNQSDKPISLLYYQYRLGEKGPVATQHSLFLRAVPPGVPGDPRARLRGARNRGKGHFVGTVLAVRTRSPAWFGEGDEKIYIDGEEHPRFGAPERRTIFSPRGG